LACMHVGVIFCPVSVAYSTASQDFSRLRDIVDLVGPSLVFAADADVHGRALRTCIPPSTEVIVVTGDAGRPATAFRDLLATTAGAAVDVAASGIGANTVAKLLFTSGSTGFPKGVITTNGMITSCVRMLMASHELPVHEPLVLVDWLPWSHVFGGTCSFGLALFQGGTLFLDDGLPLPSQIERTVRNLREITPTFYSSVPRGYEALVPSSKRSEALVAGAQTGRRPNCLSECQRKTAQPRRRTVSVGKACRCRYRKLARRAEEMARGGLVG
jgi:feruloyl-CoA synthase